MAICSIVSMHEARRSVGMTSFEQRAGRIASCCAGLNGVTLGAKTCGGKKMWPFIILYMVRKLRYLRRVARVGKSQIESKHS